MSKINLEPLVGMYLTVQDSLEFAEKKNAIITAFISSVLFSIFRYGNLDWLMTCWPAFVYAAGFVFFLFCGLLTGIFSFLPQTRRSWDFSSEQALTDINLLYFGDLQNVSPQRLVDFFFAGDNPEPHETKLRYDYARQIVICSFIATRKYFLSRMAVWFVVMGLVTPLIGIPLYLALDPSSGHITRRFGKTSGVKGFPDFFR